MFVIDAENVDQDRVDEGPTGAIISPVYLQHITSISPACHHHITSTSPVYHQYYITSISPVYRQYITSTSTVHMWLDLGEQFRKLRNHQSLV